MEKNNMLNDTSVFSATFHLKNYFTKTYYTKKLMNEISNKMKINLNNEQTLVTFSTLYLNLK